MRPVQLSREAKTIANNLIEFGFTDKLILGKAAALELMLRLQDICNGFEPVEADKFYDQKDRAFPDQKPKFEQWLTT